MTPFDEVSGAGPVGHPLDRKHQLLGRYPQRLALVRRGEFGMDALPAGTRLHADALGQLGIEGGAAEVAQAIVGEPPYCLADGVAADLVGGHRLAVTREVAIGGSCLGTAANQAVDLIVPALVLTMAFTMPDAVGMSLVVIAINSAMALGLRAGSLDILWADALPFLTFAIIGKVLGKRIADRVPAAKLTTDLVVLLIVLAAYGATSSIVQLV